MLKKLASPDRGNCLIVLVVFGLLAALALTPAIFRRAAAGTNDAPPNVSPTNEVGTNLPFYDIRADKGAAATLLRFRRAAGKEAIEIAGWRDRFAAGERRLRQTVPTLKIEYGSELGTPNLIAPDVLRGRAFLTAATKANRTDVLRDFLSDNDDIFGLSARQIERLKTVADYTNPNGELSFVSFEQFVGDVPVFRSEIRGAFNRDGALFRVVNNSAPALDYENLSKEFGDARDATTRAAAFINHAFKADETVFDAARSTATKSFFGSGDWATTAEKMYFPTEIGVARPAWRVLIWLPVSAFYVIVDAETGALLYRENITAHQTQPATYNVYANSTSLLKTMANPAPLAAPGLLDPALQTQGALQPRANVTLIGNESPYAFNNLGWISDGANTTDGNNVEAGIDRETPNGVDAAVAGTNRVFNFDYTPAAGVAATGDSPLVAAFQSGAATNLFYITNRFHDETYLLGFTEQARNFQNDNFGRGGSGGDRISAEAQDNTVGSGCAAQPCVNNANFSTPADGSRGRMQMYVWSHPEPDRDGDLDAEIVVHELAHGLFGRLHSGSIANTQAGQMNEGNSDFFAHVLLANQDDPINGVYTTGGYSTLNLRTAVNGGRSNYYYGIRRFPKAVLAFRGGANNRPHNPLTYADIDPAKMNLADGAFAPAFNGSATAVHDGGEVWSSLLWEVRARLVQRLGANVGSRRVLQLVMDGMKVAPALPSMMQERDAIIAAAQANGNGADVADIWAGFAARGLGFSATNPNGNTVSESFDLPNATLANSGFAVSDAAPGGDADGFAEPGETVQLTIPIVNNTGNTVNNVSGSVTGGGTAVYGTLPNAQTTNRQIAYTIPANAACGTLHAVTINISSDLGTQSALTRQFRVGAPQFNGTAQNFDAVAAPVLPTGWTQTNAGSNTGWATNQASATSQPNSVYAPAPDTAGQTDLITSARITSAAAQMSFKTYFNTEVTWDGTVLDIQIGDGEYQDITAAGGSFASGGYNTQMHQISPFGARMAWSGSSGGGFIDTVVILPAAASGKTVNLRWRMATDTNTTPPTNAGHRIDDIVLTGGALLTGYECASVAATFKARADFDGDGKTDLSVFRPNEGNWYLNRSTGGFASVAFGRDGDVLTPGDFDGDGKTDIAVARRTFPGFVFYILNSGNGAVSAIQWGATNDAPQIGDYDGDGRADIAVYRYENGTWYVRLNAGGSYAVQFGAGFDKPVANDYDGDGKTDIAVFRRGIWYVNRSTGGVTATAFGFGSDQPVPADYDGDGKTDFAVFRSSNATWYLQRSQLGFTSAAFGFSTDAPVPGDYDGDGKTDIAVFRNGTWHLQRTTSGTTAAAFGTGSDQPIPKQYIP